MKYYLRLFICTNLLSVTAFLVFGGNFNEPFGEFTYLFIFLSPICLAVVFYLLLLNSYFSKIALSRFVKEIYIFLLAFLFFLVLNFIDITRCAV
ncbi:hypothetical protein EGI31_07975 [Lacihabitans soyangensis]|uniref:Uncharacterized protein n=1 Tax=Lacihabitans soyangensis TaxID=869394 RepID=A0AAE3KS40_9BACT|nr:hypothetical protein [Lacihabitans soyangensis]